MLALLLHLVCLSVCLPALAAEGEGDTGNHVLEFVESSNGHKLAVRRWRPDAVYHRPRAVILIHSGAQHKYNANIDTFGTELAAAGFECVAFDQQGTGRSGGEDPRGYVNGIETLSGDLDRVLQSEVERHRNGTQFFLLGEGIGAVVVLHHAMRHRQTPHVYPSAVAVTGYLFCAPLLKPNAAALQVRMGWLMAFLKISSAVRPKMSLSSANLTSPATQTSHVLPRGVAPAFARPAFELLDAGSRIFRSAAALQFPFAIFCGSSDDRVDVSDCRRVFDTSTSMDKVLKVYEGGTSLLLEDSAEVASRFIADVIYWLDQRSDRRTAATPALDALLKLGKGEGSLSNTIQEDICSKSFANSESDGAGSCRCKSGFMMGAAAQCVPEDLSRGGGRERRGGGTGTRVGGDVHMALEGRDDEL